MVVFKKGPRRNKVLWEVSYVETDVDKIKWSGDGKTPNYIQLRTYINKRKVEGVQHECWTCENKVIKVL